MATSTPIPLLAWTVPTPRPRGDRPPPPVPLELVLVEDPGGYVLLLWRGAELLGLLGLEVGEA